MGKLLNIVIQAIVFVLSSFLLFFLCISFPEDLDNVPDQTNNTRLINYPSWEGEDFDAQIQDTICAFSITWTGFTSLLAIYWTYWYKQSEHTRSHFKNGYKLTSTTLFNQALTIMCVFGTIMLVSAFFFGFGKLFSMGGMLHSFTEMFLLLLIGTGGRIQKNYHLLIPFLVSVIIYTVILCLPWPYDAFLFRTQGLVLDWMLLIVWTCGIISSYLKYKREPEHEEQHTHLLESEAPDGTKFEPLFPRSLKHPNQLWILFLASLIHVAGDFAIIIAYESVVGVYIMLLTYGITFPLYVFYIYLDTHLDGGTITKYYYFPNSSYLKALIILVWSLLLSLGALRLSFLTNNHQ